MNCVGFKVGLIFKEQEITNYYCYDNKKHSIIKFKKGSV